ncbi:gas vesicle protein GvpL/GvpF [Streptomyces sp. SLBN-118]|uniref:GvpL/GvpF family gas vesicle protein n=1 Tax=Streptomyces sp. SLBN-118 TaxID=2768454 RepID=UPI00114FBA0B|nr:GvpL/GvpF family gas vesicle protein [Streptomyces sp. SLBN-118]TQK42613.1 gas vesicle protein GvpL/GvpF [Streptomyces sp. SLBN-118]
MNELRYVYAVSRPFGVPLGEDLRGVAAARPYPLFHRDLIAVVSAVPADDFDEIPLRAHLEDLDWLSGTARAHQAVVAALASLTSPLPLRLATVCRDDNGVRRLIDSGHDRFVRTLDRLDGRVEWGVKVYAETPQPRAAAAAPVTRPAAASSGRDYLRRRLQQRRADEGTWERADAVSRRLHEVLSRHAEADRLHRPQQGRLSGSPGHNVLNAAYLVPREESVAFVQSLDELRPQEPGIRVVLTGPWAPYSFTGEFTLEPTVGAGDR